MEYNEEQAKVILDLLRQELARDAAPLKTFKRIWWILVGIRMRSVTSVIRDMSGDKVMGGLFQGMKLTPDAIAAYNACIILGTYEHELQSTFEKIIASNYTRILNIGCSVGYYAVGLALRMPHIVIDAFDIDPEARHKCLEMAVLNGVQDRVRISGEFHGEDFATYASERTLALVDIEGAELALLDPILYPALQKIDIVVELHDVLDKKISNMVTERFSSTHHTEFIQNQFLMPEIRHTTEEDYYVDPFDRFFMAWEGRDGPTPWGVYKVKSY